jgi:hypothetical protein
MARRKRLFAGLLLASTLLTSGPALGQPSEAAVKAAFLPRFARYVTWPPPARPDAREAFQVCVIGIDPFGRALDQAAAGQGVDGHPVSIRRLQSASGAAGCHVAFVQGANGQATGQLLAALSRLPVLTVTDARSGAQRGMIHFSVVSGRVRFFIDDAEAAERGLSISSRLLALAVGVRQRRG